MNDVNDWHSVAELQNRLEIPDATIRRYIRQHGHHMQLRKRHKSYMVAAGSVRLLPKIREAYAQGLTIAEVDNMLAAAGVPTIIDVHDNGERGDEGKPHLVQLSDDMQDVKRALIALNEQNQLLASRVQQLAAENTELKRELVAEMAQIGEQLAGKRKRWWQR